MRDDGRGLDGVPGLIRSWYHRMAVAPHPDDATATLYRDRLEFDAGPLTPAVWAGLWPLWQWRGLRLKQLAPGFDEERPPARRLTRGARPIPIREGASRPSGRR